MKSPILAVVFDVLLVYALSALCRVVYVLENWNLFWPDMAEIPLGRLVHGSFMFDTVSIVYLNIVFILMALLPLRAKENPRYYSILKWIFVVVNSLLIISNIADSTYYPFTGKRTTAAVFSEFANENNLASIVGLEAARHWYLIIASAAMILALWRFYASPETSAIKTKTDARRYYTGHSVALTVALVLCFFGMRGSFLLDARPKNLRDANVFVNSPSQAAIVLNTPFSLIRSIGHSGFTNPHYFTSQELDSIFSPVHVPVSDALAFSGKNVVLFITESLGREYIGFFNKDLDSGTYKGYTPFLDSLIGESLTFEYSFANGRKSIDAMPSILSSLPMIENNFFTSPYINNEVGGLSACLASRGYRTTFFHGADNGSMGFDAYSRAIKYQDYYGRDEYNADKEFGGDDDFDGRWAIWDHNFMAFWRKHIDAMPQPFLTTIFTASSHHPFKIPEAFRDTFPEEALPMHKCIRYVDHCFREFFAHAKNQPWYKNTIFVITGDHTNQTNHAEYQTDLGFFSSPLVIFDPSGELPRGVMPSIAQQADVMPTVLGALHYSDPYVAYGIDLLNTPPDSTWALSFSNGIYQYVKGNRLLQYDGKEVKAIYDFKSDWMLTENLLQKADYQASDYEFMVTELKAMIQSYLERMIENRLTKTE